MVKTIYDNPIRTIIFTSVLLGGLAEIAGAITGNNRTEISYYSRQKNTKKKSSKKNPRKR